MAEQQFVLTDYADNQRRIAPVTGETVAAQVAKLRPGEQFRIEPEPPIPAGEGLALAAVNCARDPRDSGILLVAMLRAPEREEFAKGYVLSFSSGRWDEEGQKVPLTSAEKALAVLTRMVETGELPDFDRGWQPVKLSAATPEETRRMHAKEAQASSLGDNKGGKGGKKSW